MNEKRKIVPVGCGFTGMSVAYSFSNTGGIGGSVLIGMGQEKAVGETMDLQYGLPYARSRISIKAGSYEECRNVTVVVITVGATQKPMETRLGLTARDAVIMKDVTGQIMVGGFDGILVIASDPMDIMTYVVQKVSGLPVERVISSGTILDIARLHYIMSECLSVSISSIRTYIMGEYGNSSFVPWTNAYVGCKNLLDPLDEKGRDSSDLHDIYVNVQQTGYEIVKYKRSTYYGIGPSLDRLVHTILGDENVIPIMSAYQSNKYGQEGLYIGVPAVVNRQGIREVVKLDLNKVDQAKFNQSCEMICDINTGAVDPPLQKTNSVLPAQCAENGKSSAPAYRD